MVNFTYSPLANSLCFFAIFVHFIHSPALPKDTQQSGVNYFYPCAHRLFFLPLRRSPKMRLFFVIYAQDMNKKSARIFHSFLPFSKIFFSPKRNPPLFLKNLRRFNVFFLYFTFMVIYSTRIKVPFLRSHTGLAPHPPLPSPSFRPDVPAHPIPRPGLLVSPFGSRRTKPQLYSSDAQPNTKRDRDASASRLRHPFYQKEKKDGCNTAHCHKSDLHRQASVFYKHCTTGLQKKQHFCKFFPKKKMRASLRAGQGDRHAFELCIWNLLPSSFCPSAPPIYDFYCLIIPFKKLSIQLIYIFSCYFTSIRNCFAIWNFF